MPSAILPPVQGELLLLLVFHLVLTALPGVATSLSGARLGLRQVPVLLGLGLAATGVAAIVAFWAYYWDRTAGQSFSFFVLFGSLLLIGWSLRGGRLERALLRRLATPLLLWGLGSGFLLFLGFLHGGFEEPVGTAASRFSATLPADNVLPLFFSEWFYLFGHRGTPPVFPGEWLSSDRPPLQIGYVLAQRPLALKADAFHYQVLCVTLQQLWIVGLWALLLAARVGRVTRALAMVTVLVSGLAIVNGFFVWPKMLPTAMLLAAAALVLTPLWDEQRRSPWGAALVAALCALALLAHGGSVFGVIALALVAVWRGLPSRRWLAVAALVAIALMAPWSAYQKYGDPPGNRLTKLTLAGVTEVDDRGVGEAIVDAYGEAGLGGSLQNKGENFTMMVGDDLMVETVDNALESGEAREIVAAARAVVFFNFLPSLGLLLLAPMAMLLARRRAPPAAEWSFALVCFATVAVGAVVWGLLVFGSPPMRTVLHVGSYLLPVLAMAGAVVGLRASFPRFALYWVGCWALLSLALYVPALTPPPGTSYSFLAGLLAALSLGGFLAVSLDSRA
ncbi:MAG TPA: hypothetical protein VLI94_06605 [Solirubrobacterales bacterium]|nr:hypothetical protein [Solirubrobacterales bacterium]